MQRLVRLFTQNLQDRQRELCYVTVEWVPRKIFFEIPQSTVSGAKKTRFEKKQIYEKEDLSRRSQERSRQSRHVQI